jgi:hypothetical protein
MLCRSVAAVADAACESIYGTDQGMTGLVAFMAESDEVLLHVISTTAPELTVVDLQIRS